MTTKHVTIEITRENIIRGIPSAYMCPIARALSDYGVPYPAVGKHSWRANAEYTTAEDELPLSATAQAFVELFDTTPAQDRHRIEPRRLRIEIPTEYAR
jgi:hypothetical protein